MRYLLISLVLVFSFLTASAQTSAPDKPSDAEIEMRARQVGKSLRCVVCQNQSIDESDATLAQDMRKLVRRRLRAGDSNAEVISYMQDRYGDFVLLDPPVQMNTYFLWFAPFILLIFGLIWYIRRPKRSRGDIEFTPLNEDEQYELQRLLSDAEGEK